MPKDALTRKQKTLLSDLRAIARLTTIDYEDIRTYPRASRTATLKYMIREIARGEVVGWYTWVDEALGSKLVEYFFGGRDFIRLWKTKRFQRFNYFVLERLYPLQKLALVRDVYEIPKTYLDMIERLNNLRNAMAHSFFPENTKAFKQAADKEGRRSTVTWKGNDVFSAPGLSAFDRNMDELHLFLTKGIKRKRRHKEKVHSAAAPLMT